MLYMSAKSVLITFSSLTFLAIAILLGIGGLRYYQISLASDRDPLKQPHTKWESECGDIEFYVDEEHHAIGTMEADGNVIEFCIVSIGSYSEGGIVLLDADALEDGVVQDTEKWELCDISYKSKKTFVITVERGTYLEEGRKFTLHRVAENVFPSE